MEELTKQFTSFSWWIGVFIVGIIINIISVPLWRWTESKISKYSNSRLQKNKVKAAKRAELLDALKLDPNKQILFAMQEYRLRIRGVLSFAEVMLIFIITGIAGLKDPAFLKEGIGLFLFSFFGTIALVAMMVFLDDQRKAIQIANIIHELNKDISEDRL
jgi:hypothetical protein